MKNKKKSRDKPKKIDSYKEDVLAVIKTRKNYRVNFSEHFFERFRERYLESFSDKEICKFVYKNRHSLKHISGKTWLLSGLMVVIDVRFNRKTKKKEAVFITTYGHKKDNPIVYDLLITDGEQYLWSVMDKYGKLNL